MVRETILMEGQIITPHTLNQVLDAVLEMGGDFEIENLEIGKGRDDPSRATIQILASDKAVLNRILEKVSKQGATVLRQEEVRVAVADRDGVFPDDFYSTTNLDTEIFHQGRWIPVKNIEMDCGIRYDEASGEAECIPIIRVEKDDRIVVGREGIRVIPPQRPARKEIFSFMSSAVSSEKPKKLLILQIAARMRELRENKGRIVFVCGPAIIHTGASEQLCALVRNGYVQALLAGNALATHDIEAALFGTSLGISLEDGVAMEGGHRNHLRAINAIRRAGSIKQAVEQGILTRGVMFSCMVHNVPIVLAGSIRDDGPMPEVITDVMEAQDAMRHEAQRADMVLTIATTLHSIAVGNVLPARVQTICVDINHAVVTKLVDRGSFQAIGIVTDAESFVRELANELCPATAAEKMRGRA
jgi:lysine-ketoglutarate reductase/saccharopine dehydrogenase-like protein (TIGR00300 family)